MSVKKEKDVKEKSISHYKHLVKESLWVYVRTGNKLSLKLAEENYAKYVAFGGKISFDDMKHQAFK